MELETRGGDHISDTCKKAAAMAQQHSEPVTFTFNNTSITAQPGDTAEQLEGRWAESYETARQAYLDSDEYKARQAQQEEAYRQKCAATMREEANTEQTMRAAKVPWPYTEAQLTEYIRSLVDRQHDYGTCVYAMSMAAVAAFNYVSHQLGVTGFQASCADLDILRRTRSLDGPFMLIKAQDALYPQYDLHGTLADALEKWRPWLVEQAQKKLAENPSAHPNVLRHWQALAQMKTKKED
jgi:hypothetical protein